MNGKRILGSMWVCIAKNEKDGELVIRDDLYVGESNQLLKTLLYCLAKTELEKLEIMIKAADSPEENPPRIIPDIEFGDSSPRNN